MVLLPYTLTNGTTANAAEVLGNDQALADALSNIKNSQIASAAAIDKSKLAQSNIRWDDPIQLFAYSANNDYVTPSEFTIPEAMLTIQRWRVSLATGQVQALYMVEWYVEFFTEAAGTFPQFDCLVDSVQVGDQEVIIDTLARYWTIGKGSPVANPLILVADGSIIELRVGKNGAGAATVAGVTCRLGWKDDLVT